MAPCHRLIEDVLVESPDTRSILAIVRRYGSTGKKINLYSAMEHVALERRPVSGSSNAYELHSVDIGDLRRQLFAMVTANGPDKALAMRALVTLDELRDEHGRPELEPRHPDINSGIPWPCIES
jgi:hypothetical protein